MKRARSIAGIVCLVVLTAVSGRAATITTLFNANNEGFGGGTLYFDITVAGNPVTITGFEAHARTVGVGFEWEVYITAPGGTRVGNEDNSSAWSLVATGVGTTQGPDAQTPVTLDGAFSLEANTTYGMAVWASTSQRYTTVSRPGSQYSNSDLTLVLGSVTNDLFGGSIFRQPRVWNGSIIYELAAVPEPSTFALSLGGGLVLVGLCRRRRL